MKPCFEKSQAKIITATNDGSRHIRSVISMSVMGEQSMRVATIKKAA